MSDDHSTVTDEEGIETPQEMELSSIIDDDARALAKRYAEQERGKLTETVRHTLVEFARDPAKGLEMMDTIDPKVSKRVMKELGVNSVEEFVKKTKGLSEDDVSKILETKLKETSVQDMRNHIDTKLKELPESIRDMAIQEFKDLTDGRNLATDQLEKMAEKAVNLARIESGNFEKTAKLNLGSQGMATLTSETVKGNRLLEDTNHPFFSQFKTK